jgi:excisionase family DNA binding protein
MRAGTWPPVLDEILADLSRSLAKTVQTDALVLDVRSARPNDDAMQSVSVSEAARRLDVHRTTIARLILRGELPAIRVGARDRVRVADLERLYGEGR